MLAKRGLYRLKTDSGFFKGKSGIDVSNCEELLQPTLLKRVDTLAQRNWKSAA
jgi:hypothetical protein